MREKLTVEVMRTMLPNVKPVSVRLPGKHETCAMFKVPFAENLELVARSAANLLNQPYQFPAQDVIAPPLSLIFPTKQPMMDARTPIIENGINSYSDYQLYRDLGIPLYQPSDPVQPVIISMVAGRYQHRAEKRQLLLDRYDRATHAILHIFWLDGCAPAQAGMNCQFARCNNAIEFYRVAATQDHCGSDFWLLELKPHTLPYVLLQCSATTTDRIIAEADVELRAQYALQDVIRQQFVSSGVARAIEDLGDGWSLQFDRDMIRLHCTDNMCNRSLIIFPYAKDSLAIVQEILESYNAGQFDLIGQFGLDNLLD